MATYPQHPLYKQLPVIPGDHAFNIITEALPLVLRMPSDQRKQFAEGKLAGCTLSVSADELKTLFDQISTEMGFDVLKYLTQPGLDAHAYKIPEPTFDQLRIEHNYGLDPNYWT